MWRLLLIPLALLALAMRPELAVAAPAFFSLTTDPVPAPHGYRLSLDAWQENTHGFPARNWLAVTLRKRKGAATQEHVWKFRLEPSALRCGRLARCTLDSGRSLGGFGRVRLTLRSVGHTRRSGCAAGAGERFRTATVSGTLRFRSRMEYFGLVTRRPARGRVRSGPLDFEACRPSPEQRVCGTTELAVPYAARGADYNFVLTASNRRRVAKASFDYRPLGSAVTHRIVVKSLPRGSWSFARSFSSATLEGSVIPFFKGKLRFSSTIRVPRQSSCGRQLDITGIADGNLAVHVDGRRSFRLTGQGRLFHFA